MKTAKQLESMAANLLIFGTLAIVFSMGLTLELLGLVPASTMVIFGLVTVGAAFWTQSRADHMNGARP